MNKLVKLILFTSFFLILTIRTADSRYSVSIPFQVDSGGRPVASATVGINISEGNNCVSPFYFNKTTARYGRGEINVTSSRFIAGRVYTMCFNSTVGSNTLRGRTRFSPGVGDINVSRWVNGSSSRFNTYQLNNGSIFDVIYGRLDGNVTTVGITNIIYNGTGIKLIQAYNGTLAKDKNLVKNNTAQGKIYLNNSLYTKGNISLIYPATAINLISSGKIFYNHTIGCDTDKARCGFKFLYIQNPDAWILLSPKGLGTTTNDPTFLSGTKKIAFLTHIFPAENNLFDFGSNELAWRNVSSWKYTLKNGSSFDVIYGVRGTGGGISNNTALGKTYLNNTNGIFFSSLFKGLYGLVDNNLTIGNSGVYGINITGQYINISNSGRIVLAGTYITSWSHVNKTNNTWAGSSNILYNNSNRGKIYFNSSVFFNGTITVKSYKLRNGSTFDVIYGRLDGNVTTAGITNIIYNGTGVKLVQVYNGTLTRLTAVYNGTLAKDKNLVKNNTVKGKIYLNTSNSSLFISGNATARRYYLTNGSVFDVIYGRDTVGTGLLNNTAQGKAYLNSSLYPKDIRFGNWNISYTKSKHGVAGDGDSGEINIFANNSGFIQRSNQSQPYSKSGCFRINGANYLGPSESSGQGWTNPGTIHVGTECTQGWSQAYIDINDVNQNTSQGARLMQFFWNNKGPGSGIGMSMRLDSKNSNTILQDLLLGFTGPGAQLSTVTLMRLTIPSFNTNNSLPVGKVRLIDTSLTFATGTPIGSLVGLSMQPMSATRMKGIAGLEIRSTSIATRVQVIGLFMGRQAKTSYASQGNRSYAVMSEGSPIQLSAGTPYIYNGPFITTDNWVNLTIGNVSSLYNYDKDILVTQFAGRTTGLFNLTSMSKRQYNLSFADYVYVNDTIKIAGNATHPDLKIDKTNFTIKSFNSTAYLNCAYFKSINDGTVKLICDGVAV